MSKLFYVQQCGKYVGNSMLWWRRSNCGYTPDIRDARVFAENELPDGVRDGSKKAWPVSYINNNIQFHIDMQDCDYEQALKEKP